MEDFTTQVFSTARPRKIYSVTQVNQIARSFLENFSAWVHGEIAELEKVKTKFGNNFIKFKLKDEVTQYTLPVIAWLEATKNLNFELKNGLAVVVFGNLTLYERGGIYQFQAQLIELYGEGLLQKKFEELKKRLRDEGLFDEKYKKPILKYPVKIGVVTSETSAAWIDFKRHVVDKFPFFEIFLADVFVQGEQAVPDIVWALNRLNQQDLDVIVITRGGGSLEDLAAFNAEEVARAVFVSKIPVISAVGHERDETIADWVADVRCSTPTAAAKLITGAFEEFLVKTEHYASILTSQTVKFYQAKLLEISLLEKELGTTARSFINQKESLLENFKNNLQRLPTEILKTKEQNLLNLARELKLLSPQRILERGYSVTYKLPKLQILKDSKKISANDKIKVRLARGKLFARVLKN